MTIKVLIPATIEPIHLNEAKQHINVTYTDDDVYISALISTARQMVERITGHRFVARKERAYFNALPDNGIIDMCESSDLLKIESLVYRDSDFVATTMAASNYAIGASANHPSVYIAYNAQWAPNIPYLDSVYVDYYTGQIAPYTADSGTDTLTVANNTYVDDDVVRLHNSGGAVPAGLSLAANYYVVNSTSTSVQLAATQGGSAINIADNGTGYNYIGVMDSTLRQAMLLLIGHWYEHRETVSEVQHYDVPTAANQLMINARRR